MLEHDVRSPDSQEATLVGAKILIVDDDIEVAKTLTRLLRREQFEIAMAPDGSCALQALANFQPDLVISDYGMPAMNGAELVREIKRRRPRTACLILSGYADHVQRSESVGGEVCEVLRKPWDKNELLATVRALLVGRSERAP